MAKDETSIYVKSYDSKNVIESVIFTRSHTTGNVYRQRFLLRLVELAQQVIRDNMDTVLNGGRIDINEFGMPVLTLPVRSILADEDDKNYEKAKAAILDYLDWRIFFEDGRIWKASQVIYEPELEKIQGTFQFMLNRNIWKYLVDFTKGYSQYDLNVALSITNQLALMIYKGLPNQKGSITYSVERFREVFGFKDKYVGRTSNLIKFALEPAKRELDVKSPWSFEYILHFTKKQGQSRGRKSISGIEIVPIHRLGLESTDKVRSRVHPAQLIGNDAYHILLEKLFFTFREIKANIKLFEMAAKSLTQVKFADWLDSIVPAACRAERSTQGYVINALKNYLHSKYGIEFENESADSSLDFVAGYNEASSQDEAVSAFQERVSSLLIGDKQAANNPSDPHSYSIGDLFGGLYK